MSWTEINWADLQDKSIVDLSDIVGIARDIENVLLYVRRKSSKSPKELRDKVYATRGMVNVLINNLVNTFCTYEVGADEKSADVYNEYDLAWGRILKRLDEIQKEELLKYHDNVKMVHVLNYVIEIELILYGFTYYSLRKTIENNPKDKKAFLFLMYGYMNNAALKFGAHTREKEKKKVMFPESPPVESENGALTELKSEMERIKSLK